MVVVATPRRAPPIPQPRPLVGPPSPTTTRWNLRHTEARSNASTRVPGGIPSAKKIHHILFDELEACKFLMDVGVLDEDVDICPVPGCGGQLKYMRMWPDPDTVHIDRTMTKDMFLKRCCVNKCRKKQSVFHGTFFSGLRLPKNKIVHLIYCWLRKLSPQQAAQEVQCNPRTASQMFVYCREICISSVLDQSEENMIGGPGIEVQIDESKFGKRKYHRGHRIEGNWVFGGVERIVDETGKAKAGRSFAVVVPDRTRFTLLPIIKDRIRRGSIVISDCWGAYNPVASLKDEFGERCGYTHRKVNHSETFKDRRTGACTNTIEGQWRLMKAQCPGRQYADAERLQEHLFEYTWRQKNKGDQWNAFWNDVSSLGYDEELQQLYQRRYKSYTEQQAAERKKYLNKKRAAAKKKYEQKKKAAQQQVRRRRRH